MEQLNRLMAYISTFDSKQFKHIMLMLFGAIFALTGLLVVYYYRSVRTLKKELVQLNVKRKEVKELLERYDQVKKQQKQVDAILAKEGDFKISQFFEKLMTTVQIPKQSIQPPSTTSEDILDGYTEWTLDASIKNINMKKLTDLLHAIEQEDRIYTKELEVTAGSASTINVRLLIATLERKITGQTEE